MTTQRDTKGSGPRLRRDRTPSSSVGAEGWFRSATERDHHPATYHELPKMGQPAPVAQWIEHRFPKPCAQVRFLPGAPSDTGQPDGAIRRNRIFWRSLRSFSAPICRCRFLPLWVGVCRSRVNCGARPLSARVPVDETACDRGHLAGRHREEVTSLSITSAPSPLPERRPRARPCRYDKRRTRACRTHARRMRAGRSPCRTRRRRLLHVCRWNRP